ncbi:hypothetical protein CFP56_022377 [Quercus suber]|uniref:Uncharacterized protein n=1 Tax=Quercus suber TaxID=58331 RepID=A0AAW0KDD0_QUESU
MSLKCEIELGTRYHPQPWQTHYSL